MHKQLKIIFLILYIFVKPSNLYGQETKIISDTETALTVQVTSKYVLGDGDSRLDGRNITLQNAKKIAAEKAGSYIQSEKIIEDDEIKSDTIKAISTAFMSVSVIEELISLTPDNRTELTLTIQAVLDKSSFFGKLGIIKNDVRTKQQIASLRKSNDDLQNELEKLNQEIQSLKTANTNKITQKPRKELIERRDVVLSEMEQNESNIRKVFEKGTLFKMAMQNSDDFDKAKQGINTNVFQHIVNNTKISMNDPQFLDNGDGTYNIEVVVKWDMDTEPILTELNKHFWDNNRRQIVFKDCYYRQCDGIKVKELSNNDEDKKKPYSAQLYKFYTSKAAIIELVAGTHKSQIPIMAIYRRFTGFDGPYQEIIPRSDADISKSTSLGSNKVIIKNVPSSILENLTAIDAKVLLVEQKN